MRAILVKEAGKDKGAKLGSLAGQMGHNLIRGSRGSTLWNSTIATERENLM